MSRAGVVNCLFLLAGSVILGLGCSQKAEADPPVAAKGKVVDEDESIVPDGKGGTKCQSGKRRCLRQSHLQKRRTSKP